jgi:hypothetical protein
LALASLIRNLLREWRSDRDPRIAAQIAILKRRINLIRLMQGFVIGAILCCVLSMLAIYAQWHRFSGPLFVAGLGSMVVSLLVSLGEIQLSSRALNLQLQVVEFDMRPWDSTDSE